MHLPLLQMAALDGGAGAHLEWALSWSWGSRALVLALGLAILGMAALNLRQLASWPRRGVLLGLRALVVTSLLAVVFQPTWVSLAQRPGSRRVAVVVDRSLSMAHGEAGQRRWDRAVAVAEPLAAAPGAALFALSDSLEPVDGVAQLRSLQPDGEATDLLAALSGLADAQRMAGLSAVVLISDGLDNGALQARNPGDVQILDAESSELVESLQVPVHGLFVDDPEPVRDVAVAALRTSSFGFTRTWMPVAVDLEISGYDGQEGSLALVLSDNGKPVVTRQLPLAGPGRRTIELDYQPLHVGTHLLEAAVLPLDDEATQVNNRAWAGLRVVRDRTRVLHLAGHPSWDTRFLRTHLRGDPSVDLISFYVMVGQGAGAFVSAEDTTLIPFPTREIFEDSLSSFDLVVFQDFPFGPFQVEQYLPQLRNYVHGGGAFLVIGGKQALSAGGYYGTALAEWLPLRLQPLTGADTGYRDGTVTPTLTPAGESHPVTRLEADPAANAQAWARHGFSGRNTALQPSDTGHVLVADAGGHPLLAVAEAGEGRSAVLATDSLWTWAFPAGAMESARDRSRGDYHRLMDRMSAWLLRDPDLDGLHLEGPAEPVPPGQAIRLRATAVTGLGKPAPGVQLQYVASPLTQVPAEGRPAVPAPGPTDARGQVELAIADLPAGPWLITVEGLLDGRMQKAAVPVVVASAARETVRLQPDDRLLRAVAQASDGSFWTGAPPALAGIPLAQRDPAEYAERVHTDLWSRPEVLLWLVLLLGLEWALRRRWGLA